MTRRIEPILYAMLFWLLAGWLWLAAESYLQVLEMGRITD